MSMNETAQVAAVITSYNQGSMICEAVESVCAQTKLPQSIIIVDDGSKDAASLEILKSLEIEKLPIPLKVIYQENAGVSAARNTGIRMAAPPFVMVLDGDDKIEPQYIEKVSYILENDPAMVAASSWMRTFGVMDSVVCPTGGKIGAFLSHNCCPATHIMRKAAFDKSVGYDEAMRSGFEDWDFFLGLLETDKDAKIGIVESPLINYRTAPESSNVRSMDKRLELMRVIMDKHSESYHTNMAEALLGIEAISNERLYAWENEMLNTLENGRTLSKKSAAFIQSPTYGDGGMASAVRIVSAVKKSFEL